MNETELSRLLPPPATIQAVAVSPVIKVTSYCDTHLLIFPYFYYSLLFVVLGTALL